MSYILDALKKSDQERQQNNGPGLQTIQRSHSVPQQFNRRRVIIVVLSLCCVLMVGLTVFFFQKQDFLSTIIADFQGQGDADKQLLSQLKHPKSEPTVSDNNAKPVRKVTVNTILQPPILVRFWELPDPIKKHIPAMTFSFHVYSDNPQRRTIIINKRRVKEGERVSENLLLEEITEQGIILNWKKKYRFSINVVESW